MINTGGLALDQAPPIHIPARFFLTAPLFAISAGLLLAWEGPTLLVSRWTPGALAATHLIAIGYLGLIMCGALLQMLPVVAGAPVPAVRWVGTVTHLFLTLGALGLAWGLAGGGQLPLAVGATAAGAGFLGFLGPVALALTRARGAPGTLIALRAAALSLLVTLVLGLLLIAVLFGWIPLNDFTRWVDGHAAWGLLGWVGLLVVGVAIQVLPMFYVTPAYPAAMRRWLAPLIFVGIGLGSLLWSLAYDGLGRLLFGLIALGYVGFAGMTVVLIARRDRRRPDATLMHWWAALASIALAALAWTAGAPTTSIGLVLLIGLGVGLPAGMLFKILPFLAWFHLQHRQLATGRFDRRIPHMGHLLSTRWSRIQFALHLSSLLLLIAATVRPELARAAGLALALSSVVLWILLLGVVRTYRHQVARLAEPT